ncbi:MAG: zinc-dependent alcohol dehydrogenase family protein [Suipraeoptans sp.]
MKAAVYHGKEDLRVEEVAEPMVQDDEVKVHVKYCGICGTDIHIFHGDGGSADVTPPLVPGHEFSGVVSEVGSKVTRVQVGDRVTVDPNDMCESCYYCRNGQRHFCENMNGIGTSSDGGFAEYVVTREKQVYKVADSLSFLKAAMTEPLACCLHGIDLCNIKSGDNVLVIGGGPIGMIMMQLAKSEGATKVIMSEPVEEKRTLALKLGADIAVDPINEDLSAILNKECKNVDVVIECAGLPATQNQSIKLAGKGATVMLFGLSAPTDNFPLHSDDVFKKELKVTSSFINPYTCERALQILEADAIEVEELITDIVPLDNIVDTFVNPEYRRAGKVVIQLS